MRVSLVGLLFGVTTAIAAQGCDDTCECSMTINGETREWSGCGETVCLAGVTLSCSDSGVEEEGPCIPDASGVGTDDAATRIR